MPAVVMKCQNKTFRRPITSDTRATILMDVVTTLPFPTPFAFITPIIFDDEEEPYWTNVFLHLFHIKTIRGVPIVTESNSQARTSRPLVKTFCQNPSVCGLIIVDAQCRAPDIGEDFS